jgi:hypothetical protein
MMHFNHLGPTSFESGGPDLEQLLSKASLGVIEQCKECGHLLVHLLHRGVALRSRIFKIVEIGKGNGVFVFQFPQS